MSKKNDNVTFSICGTSGWKLLFEPDIKWLTRSCSVRRRISLMIRRKWGLRSWYIYAMVVARPARTVWLIPLCKRKRRGRGRGRKRGSGMRTATISVGCVRVHHPRQTLRPRVAPSTTSIVSCREARQAIVISHDHGILIWVAGSCSRAFCKRIRACNFSHFENQIHQIVNWYLSMIHFAVTPHFHVGILLCVYEN